MDQSIEVPQVGNTGGNFKRKGATTVSQIPYEAIERMVEHFYKDEQKHFLCYPAPNHIFHAIHEVQKWLERERSKAA
jgi:hypothetical protein